MLTLDKLVDYKLTFEEARASSSPVTYALSGSGLVVVYKTLLGTFWTVRSMSVPGLPPVTPGFELAVPKPPLSVLLDALALLKQAHALHGTETLALIYFDHQKQEYFVDCPPQQVSSASVRYTKTPQRVLQEAQGEVSIFMEIHSHPGSMDTFSSTDDADEKGIWFFAVASSMRAAIPAVTISFGVAGHRHMVDSIDKVFDITLPDYRDLIKERVQNRPPLFTPSQNYINPQGKGYIYSPDDDFFRQEDDDAEAFLTEWRQEMGLIDPPFAKAKPLLLSVKEPKPGRRGRPPKAAKITPAT